MTNLGELQSARYGSFAEIFKKMRELSERYDGLSPSRMIDAFAAVGGLGSAYSGSPYVQNRRIKAISSLPEDYSKDKVADMIKAPYFNELPLRQVEHSLEYSAYPLYHMRRLYTELLTYRNYIMPNLADKATTERDDFWREWKLLEKLREAMRPADVAHEIAGQVLQEGKVFYYPRISVDKVHNKVNYVFMQQLPSDWCKIVGYNNVSKYTVAFDMMYFCLPGTDISQYGDLFLPFWDDFCATVTKQDGKIRGRVDITEIKRRNVAADVYCEGGRWFYWVVLPCDEVFPFEADDVSRTAISPFTGLFIDMIQLSQLESIALTLLQNPLISILTGEIPYWQEKHNDSDDAYKLSNAGRELFTAMWYNMMQTNNTQGIGIYMAPLQNMKLETLSEVPGATEIVSKGYQDTMSKAGLTAIVPVGAEARAGAVNVSLAIESKFLTPVYQGMERMMDALFTKLRLKYDWKFKMFGDLATEKDVEKQAMDGMAHGILSDTLTYLAIHGRSLLADISLTDAVVSSGIMEKRYPLISSYNAKQDSGLLPPRGRPQSEDTASSEGHEQDIDNGV